MKHIRLLALIAAVLMLSATLLTSCDQKPAGNDTTAADTTADTPTEAPTDIPEEPAKTGCQSSALASVAVITACAASVALAKKREE